MGKELQTLSPKSTGKPTGKRKKAERDTHPQLQSTGCGSSMFAFLVLGGIVVWFCLRVAG
jgi:hypothetical protein